MAEEMDRSGETPSSGELKGDGKKNDSREPLKIRLRAPYHFVKYGGGQSFGGSQNWFSGMFRRCGCGVISAADTLLYLAPDRLGFQDAHRKKRKSSAFSMHELEQYRALVRRLSRFFPMIPYQGMPGFLMAAYLDFYMRTHRIPYRAVWGRRGAGLKETVARMLEQDIPVPFCVGPCLHLVFRRPAERGLRLYEKRNEEGKDPFVWVKTVRSHFMTITALEGNMAEVSSWGERYWISLPELEKLSFFDGLGLCTNIIRIRRK